jgi:hypothetical protein
MIRVFLSFVASQPGRLAIILEGTEGNPVVYGSERPD